MENDKDLFGDFGCKEMTAISRAMDEACLKYKHIGCLVELGDDDRPKVTVSLLSWVDSNCILSYVIAQKLARIVSRVTGHDYRWTSAEGKYVIAEAREVYAL